MVVVEDRGPQYLSMVGGQEFACSSVGGVAAAKATLISIGKFRRWRLGTTVMQEGSCSCLVIVYTFPDHIMALVNAATRGLACQNCRSWVLRSFITSLGGASTPTLQRRTFARPARNLNEAREKFQLREEHALNSINDHVEVTRDAFEAAAIEEQETLSKQDELAAEEEISLLKSEDTATESHVPWYLQSQQEEQVVESPMAHRQRLPDLPAYAPELLQPLLQHVSVELGMDDLTLLDLRQLDPPPALGSNLLMIIGTARSEKHLHVSADRLCRWLRTEYKMKPYADGLLGRNELKLKIRRKVKRARLMSAVGSSATGRGDLDDGIRTGWVCVNVGRVEGGELPADQSKLQRAEGMVGFGAHTTGSNIVVQMLTEEKRAEVDLEKLWTGIMNRAQKATDKEAEDARIDASPEESALRDAAPKVITYRP
jgi:hypothetical protein